jgi:hypothetical protein
MTPEDPILGNGAATISARKSRVRLSTVIQRVGNILYSGRSHAFSESELQRLAGEKVQARDVRYALLVLGRGNNFRQNPDGHWYYSGRF